MKIHVRKVLDGESELPISNFDIRRAWRVGLLEDDWLTSDNNDQQIEE